MLSMPSNGVASAAVSSLPTPSQTHKGQLQDYELLLSVMRGEEGSLADVSKSLLRPSTFSPLDREHETGQAALQQLIEDPDFSALCRSKTVPPNYLIVTLTNGTFVYETSNQDGTDRTELTLTGNAKWQVFRSRIEKTVSVLGGEIRYDGLIPASRIATFYGMAPWDPTNTVENQIAIDALREKIASYKLGLEDDFNVLDLKANQSNKVLHFFSQRVPSEDAKDELENQFLEGTIKSVVQTFLPEGITSALTYLAEDILTSVSLEKVRAQPSVFLHKILHSPTAIKLGSLLLSALDWYGAKPGEETSPHIRTKVIANALHIWFKSRLIDYPDRIAGYDLQSRSNWGKPYKSIRSEFEEHLLTSKRAASDKEAVVMARLFLCQFPTEFRITDIPDDLPYRTSVVWVNFVNGVNIVATADPEALYRKTFQQLINLPLKFSAGATKEQLYEVSLARLVPTVDWAVTQGIIPHKPYEKFTQAETEQAVSELDKYTHALNDAIVAINKPEPKRLSIAETVVEDYLHVLHDGNSANPDFWSGHKLAQVPPGARLNPQQYVIERYSAIDVVAEDKLAERAPWSIFKNEGVPTPHEIWLDENRLLQVSGSLLMLRSNTFPDVKTLFDERFKNHIKSITTAYETLIKSLLSALPFSDRQALESGKLSVYTLRKETFKVEARRETPDIILPRRARNGLLLLTTHKGVTRTFELLPRAGIVRRIDNLDAKLFGGELRYDNGPIGVNSNPVQALRHKTLPFDWKAHSTGSRPQSPARCEAIIEQLGDPFTAPTISADKADATALTINSERCREISQFIASQLLFVDPKALREAAYGQTMISRDAAKQKRIDEFLKLLVPFWRSVEDITSDDTERKVNGAFGLSVDLVSFGLPIGRFASGSAKLISNANRLTLSTRLTAFAALTKEVAVLALLALNPADGIGTLLKALGSKGLKFIGFGSLRLKALAGTAGKYNSVQSLPQVNHAGRWKPLSAGDELATVRGIDDVPIRRLSATDEADYRLVDPISSRPYGPSLSPTSGELSLGRSHYRTLENQNNNVVVELSENSRVREIIEVDGRATLFIDDQAYRLKDGVLRRANLTDADDTYKAIPCRIKRMPGADVCKTSYVLRDPAPTPDVGSFDDAKGWAPWFGDITYTPATGRAAMAPATIATNSTVQAVLEFKKGIYGRVMASVRPPQAEFFDDFRVGCIMVDATDGSKQYVYMRLHAGDFFVAERATGQSVLELLTFKKAETLPVELRKELDVVYAGSLNANNMVRIHGHSAVDRALKAMDDIAVPIGVHANPPDTLKLLKVDTSPAEAALFDHATRLIVRSSTDGAATWSLSKAAPDRARETTAAIFNTLFQKKVVTVSASVQGGPKALKIDDTMRELQRLISRKTGRTIRDPRNIAFAEIQTKGGAHEVYVSVSGNQGDTGYLPLFAKNRSTDHVVVDGVTYINIDHNARFPASALDVSPQGKLQAIPHTISNVETYTPALTARPTSLDTESKLIGVIRGKYPDPKELESITIATTMPPCDSCSVVMKQFGYDGSADALNVVWK